MCLFTSLLPLCLLFSSSFHHCSLRIWWVCFDNLIFRPRGSNGQSYAIMYVSSRWLLLSWRPPPLLCFPPSSQASSFLPMTQEGVTPLDQFWVVSWWEKRLQLEVSPVACDLWFDLCFNFVCFSWCRSTVCRWRPAMDRVRYVSCPCFSR